MFGDTVQRVTARKDEWHEVEDFICNECRFEHKNVEDWIIEGPRKFEKPSVINVNNYIKPTKKVKIETDELVLEGRDQDRKKISMAGSPYDENELEAIEKTKEE